jgi:hypothetical protein
VTAVVTIAYLVARGAKSAASSHSSTSGHVLDWIMLALVVFLIARST